MKVLDTISSNPIKSKCLEVVGLTLVVDLFPPWPRYWNDQGERVERKGRGKGKRGKDKGKDKDNQDSGFHSSTVQAEVAWLQDTQNHLEGIIPGSHVEIIVFVVRYLNMGSLRKC